MRPVLLLLLSFLLGAAAPTPAERAWLAAQPVPDATNTEQAVKVFFETQLRDPESARWTLKAPVRAVFLGPTTGKRIPSVFVCGKVNAKNAYGGYAGATTFIAFFDGVRVNEGYFATPRALFIQDWCDQVYRDAVSGDAPAAAR